MGTSENGEKAARGHINGWSVTYETRERDAQGAFLQARTSYVIAENKETALRWAMDDLNSEGFETRFPLQAQRLGEAKIKEGIEKAQALMGLELYMNEPWKARLEAWITRLKQMLEECG